MVTNNGFLLTLIFGNIPLKAIEILNENDLNPSVYIGLKLPLEHGSQGFFGRTQKAIEQTKYNIKNLLLTKKGERLGNPTFGSDLEKIIFEQEGDDLENKVENLIKSTE